MLPALWPGDLVEIASCSPEDVGPGEILLALRDGRLFLHRLLTIQPNAFVLRGDSMPASDPPFEPEALLGRVVRSAEPRIARIDRSRVFSASRLSQAVGTVLCHCRLARRLALRLHNGNAWVGELHRAESV